MRLDQDLANFMSSPVMIILGTSNDALQPEIGRAVGALVRLEGDVELVLSAWQWPGTLSNVRASGRLSATFARPSDYVSYQVKGRAVVVPTTEEHRAGAAAYIEAISAALEELGLAREVSAPWLVSEDLAALSLSVESVFVQTPGAKAGQMLQEGR
ncbi:hypothetical protein [Pelagibacterium sp. H642]|uniref:hypothetical protein n=1 Tax=Pelagibacterium sp. H642 TaxID=1881069 RepID=UPI0028164340|nr:hypothetical protein [Pelagibacterium sp. H642]WMT92699.1 hypothetical protein NO934_20410 [Pelagibacterium sp. H642]